MSSLALATRRLSVPQALVASAALGYALLFGVLLLWGRPGLGLGGTFYVPVVLAALAAGPLEGALAGLAAILLYEAAVLLAGNEGWSSLATAPTLIRLGSYVAAGAIVGSFAVRARQLMAESLGIVDELLALARRDTLTGTLTLQGLEAAINRRLALRSDFVLLLGDIPAAGGPREVTAAVAAQLAPGDTLAHVAGARAAILGLAESPVAAEQAAVDYEEKLRARFGWAVHPHDGADALTLYGAALERLHARPSGLDAQIRVASWPGSPSRSPA